MPYELISFEDFDPKTWDDFVMAQPSGSIHQISTWKTFQEQIPGRDQVMGFALRKLSSSGSTRGSSNPPLDSPIKSENDNNILITCLCIKRDVGFKNKFWFYSPRGPVFREDLPQDALDFFIKEVSKKLKKAGAMFWRLDPYFSNTPSTGVNPGVKKASTLLSITNSKPATQQYQPTDSLVLDITPEPEAILAQMKRKGRYNIKLAREKGVKIEIIPSEKVTQSHLDQYWELSQETAGRDGFQTHDKAYHEKFVKLLTPYANIAFARYQGKPIAAVINTCCGDKSIYYFGASSGNPQYRPLMAPYLLQWEMIQYAKSQGCQSYDFTGITPENQPDHPYKGITQFKMKFGGARATFQPAREIALQPGWYQLYRLIKKLKK